MGVVPNSPSDYLARLKPALTLKNCARDLLRILAHNNHGELLCREAQVHAILGVLSHFRPKLRNNNRSWDMPVYSS